MAAEFFSARRKGLNFIRNISVIFKNRYRNTDAQTSSMNAVQRRVLERRRNIFGFEQRIVSKNFLMAGAGGEQVEDVFDPDPQAAQTRTTATLLRVEGYAIDFGHVSARKPANIAPRVGSAR